MNKNNITNLTQIDNENELNANEKKKSYSYAIRDFMTSELMLSGSKLSVFAIIYSFTHGSTGIFYGTQEYMASALGCSTATVKRAIKKLIELGYVEKCSYRGRTSYKSTVTSKNDEEMAKAAQESHTPTDEPNNDAERKLPPKHILDMAGIDVINLLSRDIKRPKYEFHFVGTAGCVSMTAEQYRRLLRLVSPDVLDGYIRKLELLILNKGYRTFNPYKTIRSWILYDTSL